MGDGSMRVGRLLLVGGTALALTLAGCGSDDSSSQASDTAAEDGTSTSARPALCAAVDRLGRSVRAFDDTDSMAEFRAKFKDAREDYEAVQQAAGGEYSANAGQLDQAMANVEDGSAASRAAAAAKLSQGYERLDTAIPCP
jgi:hypothetical protein